MIKRINGHLNKNDKLLKHGLIILIASLMTGFINYLYQLYMGRVLGPEQYGVLGALFSIAYIGMFSLGSVSTITSKLVSEYKSRNKFGEIKALFYFALGRLFLIGILVSSFVVIFKDSIADYLNLPNVSTIYMLATILLIEFLSPIIWGMLNGMQLFVWAGTIYFIDALIKLSAGIILVYYGFGVNGALIGLLFGLLSPLILVLLPLRHILKFSVKKINHTQVFKYAFPAMAVVIVTTLIINIDIILVKHRFNDFDAGIYVAASTLAKIIWFASTPLITVMLPKVSPHNGTSILRHTLFYVALIGFGIALLYLIAPIFVVKTLFGVNYLNAVEILGLFGVSIALFSATLVMITYNLALKRLGMLGFAILALIAEVFSINYVASTISEVVMTLLMTNIVLFLSMLVYTKKYLLSKDYAIKKYLVRNHDT